MYKSIQVVKKSRALSCIDNKTLLVSQGYKLFIYHIDSKKFDYVVSLPISLKYKILTSIPFIRRLLRLDCKLAVKINTTKYMVLYKNILYELDINNPSIKEIGKFIQALNITDFGAHENKKLFYGEYKYNISKDEINIYEIKKNTCNKLYTFPKGSIDHVHNIIPDYNQNVFWILTGDFGDGAAIWKSTFTFSKIEIINKGSQLYRACVAFPLPNNKLIYATDSQYEKNYIILYDDGEKTFNKIHNLNGSCIYGAEWKGKLYFSTTVEPYSKEITTIGILGSLLTTKRGPGILTNESTIVECNEKLECKKIYANKKDYLPFIFQFGSITFPSSLKESDYFVFNTIGLRNNNMGFEIWQ